VKGADEQCRESSYTTVNSGIGGGTDALDYDPINQTVYVINGTAPNYMTGINLVTKTIASQLQLPRSPELMKFNPIDGKFVQVITDGNSKGVVVFDPASNSITATYNKIPNCTSHGIAVDPIANVLPLGCGTNRPQVMLNVKDGTVLKTFPDVTGTDLVDYNPNLVVSTPDPPRTWRLPVAVPRIPPATSR
jgi:hypothetical protein